MIEELDCVAVKIALAKVSAEQIRPLARNEIHHARPFDLAVR